MTSPASARPRRETGLSVDPKGIERLLRPRSVAIVGDRRARHIGRFRAGKSAATWTSGRHSPHRSQSDQERPLFSSYRGSPPLDPPTLADLIARLGQVLDSDPSIRKLNLNPVIAYPAGQDLMALHALMLIQRPEPCGSMLLRGKSRPMRV